MRKWDFALVAVGAVVFLASLLVQSFLVMVLVLGMGVIHLSSRYREEKKLSGSESDVYPMEENSQRYTLLFSSITGLTVFWLILIGLLPLEHAELVSAVSLIAPAFWLWMALQFLFSMFKSNKFTVLAPFSAFGLGILYTVWMAIF